MGGLDNVNQNVFGVVALLVSLVALITTVLQVLQQYYSSAEGYRRCADSVMGLVRNLFLLITTLPIYVLPNLQCTSEAFELPPSPLFNICRLTIDFNSGPRVQVVKYDGKNSGLKSFSKHPSSSCRRLPTNAAQYQTGIYVTSMERLSPIARRG